MKKYIIHKSIIFFYIISEITNLWDIETNEVCIK